MQTKFWLPTFMKIYNLGEAGMMDKQYWHRSCGNRVWRSSGKCSVHGNEPSGSHVTTNFWKKTHPAKGLHNADNPSNGSLMIHICVSFKTPEISLIHVTNISMSGPTAYLIKCLCAKRDTVTFSVYECYFGWCNDWTTNTDYENWRQSTLI